MSSNTHHRYKTPPDTKPYNVKEDSCVDITTRYPYGNLQTNHRFRLLQLFPESYEPPVVQLNGIGRSKYLHGTLSEHELSEDVSYECLSYVWGSDRTHKLIWIDTYVVEVSENLDMALRRLQHKTETRTLWVDFICINQQNLEERKNQVQIMYQIFSKAEKVVAYLGETADGSEKLIYFLDRVVDAQIADSEFCNEPNNLALRPWTEEDCNRLGLPSFKDDIWLTLQNFISRPWFVRIWIMQEALAAKTLDLICGRWLCPASVIFKVIEVAMSRQIPFTGTWSNSDETYQLPELCGVKQFHLMMELGLCEIRCSKTSLSSEQWSLIDILEQSRLASCTDPRDYVFALLNLCKDEPALDILPDYTASVATIYKRVARALVNAGKGHKVLCNAFMSDSTLDIPSWVPDWLIRGLPFKALSTTHARSDHSGGFKAGGINHAIRLCTNQDELLVSVYAVDFVADLGELYDNWDSFPTTPETVVSDKTQAGGLKNPTDQTAPLTEDPTNNQEVIDKECLEFPSLFKSILEILFYVQKSSKYTEKDHTDLVCRTVICDRKLGRFEKAPAEYNGYFLSYCMLCKLSREKRQTVLSASIKQNVLESLLDGKIDSEEQRKTLVKYCLDAQMKQACIFAKAAQSYCRTMVPAFSETGFVGMVPRRTQLGDVVVVIKGVNVPMVLRPEGGGRFKLVGQAYFHDFMNGEVFKMNDMKEEEVVIV